MKVYFNPAWGIFFIAMGVVLLFLNLVLLNLGAGRGLQLVFSLFISLIGILYMTRPYFELRANELVMFNLFGMELKNYPFQSLKDFQTIDNKIYLNTNGKSKRIRLSKTMAKKADWEKFIQTIRNDDLTSELHNI